MSIKEELSRLNLVADSVTFRFGPRDLVELCGRLGDEIDQAAW